MTAVIAVREKTRPREIISAARNIVNEYLAHSRVKTPSHSFDTCAFREEDYQFLAA